MPDPDAVNDALYPSESTELIPPTQHDSDEPVGADGSEHAPHAEPGAPQPEPPGKVRLVEIMRDRSFRAVIFGTFVIMLGYGILSPILPLYARSFGVGYGSVGLLTTPSPSRGCCSTS